MKNLFFICVLTSLSAHVYAQSTIDPELVRAIRYGQFNIFIENGNIFNVNVNGRDDAENTLLHHAVEYDGLEIVRLLLLVGADPHLQNAEGQTSLQIAVDKRDRYKELFCRFFDRCISYIDSDEEVRDSILGPDARYWFDGYVRQTAIVSLFREPVAPVISDSPNSTEAVSLIIPGMPNIDDALTLWVRDPFDIIGPDVEYPDNI